MLCVLLFGCKMDRREDARIWDLEGEITDIRQDVINLETRIVVLEHDKRVLIYIILVYLLYKICVFLFKEKKLKYNDFC